MPKIAKIIIEESKKISKEELLELKKQVKAKAILKGKTISEIGVELFSRWLIEN